MTTKCLAQPATIFSWVRQPLRDKERTSVETGGRGDAVASVICTELYSPSTFYQRETGVHFICSVNRHIELRRGGMSKINNLLHKQENKANGTTNKLSDHFLNLGIPTVSCFFLPPQLHGHNFHSAHNSSWQGFERQHIAAVLHFQGFQFNL